MGNVEGRALASTKKENLQLVLFFFVRAKGIEPIRLSAPDPKSGLSTNFNTPAKVFLNEKADFHLLYLVAGVGIEPHDLRVMSPTSYQLLDPAILDCKYTDIF